MNEDYKREMEDRKRESGGHKRENEGYKRGSEGHRKGSGDCKRESESHKRESEGRKEESEGHKRESGGRKRESGSHKRESEGRKRESEDRKRDIRTQGKFSEMSMMKSRDKRQKSSPVLKEPEKKTHKKYEIGGSSNSYIDEDISPVKYQENSDYDFDQLKDQKKSIEIDEPGKRILSNTENGESVIFYEPELLKRTEAQEYFDRLVSSINWYSKNIVINGEEFSQPRLIAWFGPYPYSYSGATLEPNEMPDCVLEIKSKVEEFLSKHGFKATFNSVLLNLYRDGKDSVAWHSDDESTMGICPTIASVSLGEIRRFEMRRKKKYSDDDNSSKKQDEYFIYLEHGSLIVMDGCMQDDWQHRVPKEYHDKEPRINLTFRTVYPIEEVSHRERIREFKKERVNEWTSNRASRSKNNFDDDDFPPLKREDFPSLQSEDDFPPLQSEDNFPPLQSEDDFPPLQSEDTFPPLQSEDNFPPLQSEDNFPPLQSEDNPPPLKSEEPLRSEDYLSQLNNNDVNPILSPPPSDVRIVSLDSSSNSSVRNEELNVPYEHWDSETSSNEKFKAERDLSTDHSFNNNFEINEVKKYEKFIDDNDNSFEMNSAEGSIGDSVSSSDIVNREPLRSELNVEAKVFVPKNLLPYQGPDYSRLSLSDLIHYEVELMSAERVQEFSRYLKLRVSDKLNDFSRFIREELEFLCLLTDGSQTEKNQKLISMRIINFVSKDFQRQQIADTERFHNRHPRTHSFGKPNNSDRGRYRQNQGRANAHRY